MVKDRDPDDIHALVDRIFHPHSIAIVGASANPDTPGYDYVSSLQKAEYRGGIYPVNPKAEEILGLRVYRSLAETPGEVDYVISCIPSAHIIGLLEDCAAKRVRALQLFTGRFSETGKQNAIELEERLRERARELGVRIIGPNCMGVLHPKEGISFRADMATAPGPIGFLSQSGNLLFELTHFAGQRGFRFSKAVSYGNALDLNECDFLEYLADDPETTVVGAYIEGIRDGRRFLATLKAAAAKKAVVVLKGGRTSAGGRAAASHTAALAGSSVVWNAAVAQAGAVAVDTVEDLIDLLLGFAYLKPLTLRGAKGTLPEPQGERPRLAMVGAGGGRSVLTADLCEELGLSVPPLPDDVERKVAENAPDLAGWVTNPVDQSILAGSGLGGAQVLEWLDASPAIEMLVGNIGEPWAFGRPGPERIISRVAERFIEVARRTSKPFAVVMGPSDYSDEAQWRAVSNARERLAGAGVALFPSVERAVRTLAKFAAFWRARG